LQGGQGGASVVRKTEKLLKTHRDKDAFCSKADIAEYEPTATSTRPPLQ
jgi:hypothetical protein